MAQTKLLSDLAKFLDTSAKPFFFSPPRVNNFYYVIKIYKKNIIYTVFECAFYYKQKYSKFNLKKKKDVCSVSIRLIFFSRQFQWIYNCIMRFPHNAIV